MQSISAKLCHVNITLLHLATEGKPIGEILEEIKGNILGINKDTTDLLLTIKGDSYKNSIAHLEQAIKKLEAEANRDNSNLLSKIKVFTKSIATLYSANDALAVAKSLYEVVNAGNDLFNAPRKA